jgi:P4 family phage/plasmid primase-like protien
MEKERLLDSWKEVAGVVYSTFGNDADNPQFRLVVLLSAPIPNAAQEPYGAYYRAVAQRLGLFVPLEKTEATPPGLVRCDATSDNTRLFFLPQYRPEHKSAVFRISLTGQPVDLESITLGRMANDGGMINTDGIAATSGEEQPTRAELRALAKRWQAHHDAKYQESAAVLLAFLDGEPFGEAGTRHQLARDLSWCLNYELPELDRQWFFETHVMPAYGIAFDRSEIEARLNDWIKFDSSGSIKAVAIRREVQGEPATVEDLPELPELTEEEKQEAVGATLEPHADHDMGCETKTHAFAAAQVYNRERWGLMFCKKQGGWFWWNGRHWEAEASHKAEAAVLRLAVDIEKEHQREISKLATALSNCPDNDPRRGEIKARIKEEKSGVKWSNQLRNKSGVSGVRDIMEGLFTVGTDQLNTALHVFPVANGLIDLTSGRLEPHRPELYYTHSSPIVYDEKAECPRWEQFLEEIQGEDNRAEWLQRCVGYALSGNIKERVAFFLCGTGANGKSVFLETLLNIAGEMGTPAAQTLVMKPSNGEASSTEDTASINGKRIVVISEVRKNSPLDEQQFKKITGGDTISARHLYGKPFKFRPQCKIFVAVNHLPRVDEGSQGVWDRIVVVPFETRIEKEKRDRDLIDKLQQEAAGILRWAVEGCLAYRRRGLFPLPQSIIDRSDKYMTDSNNVTRFVARACEVQEAATTKRSELYEAYTAWAQNEREKHWQIQGPTAFYEALEEAGYTQKKLHGGVRVIVGLVIKTRASTGFEDPQDGNIYHLANNDY